MERAQRRPGSADRAGRGHSHHYAGLEHHHALSTESRRYPTVAEQKHPSDLPAKRVDSHLAATPPALAASLPLLTRPAHHRGSMRPRTPALSRDDGTRASAWPLARLHCTAPHERAISECGSGYSSGTGEGLGYGEVAG